MDDIREEIREVNGERILPEEEQLIGRFFAENTVELQDCGFTNRVMRRLPDRSVCLNRIWTAICLVAAVAVFILTKGWISLLHRYGDPRLTGKCPFGFWHHAAAHGRCGV